MNVYYSGTGDYVLLFVGKKSGPGNAPTYPVTTGIQTSIVPTGSPTPTSGWLPTSTANGAPAVDITSLAPGTYDLYVKVADPDNPGRYPIDLAGSFMVK